MNKTHWQHWPFLTSCWLTSFFGAVCKLPPQLFITRSSSFVPFLVSINSEDIVCCTLSAWVVAPGQWSSLTPSVSDKDNLVTLLLLLFRWILQEYPKTPIRIFIILESEGSRQSRIDHLTSARFAQLVDCWTMCVLAHTQLDHQPGSSVSELQYEWLIYTCVSDLLYGFVL